MYSLLFTIVSPHHIYHHLEAIFPERVITTIRLRVTGRLIHRKQMFDSALWYILDSGVLHFGMVCK